MLSNLLHKYESHEHFQKRINITSFQEGLEEYMEEEDVLEFQDSQCSEILTCIKKLVQENAVEELKIGEEDQQRNNYATTYGPGQKPFGILRTRVVEFLSTVYQIFPKEAHQLFKENGIFNTLLYFFELYPFHNILHQKISDIFLLCMSSNADEIPYMIENTDLVKKILDISRESSTYKFQGGARQIPMGYNAFIRKLANKLVDI